MHPRNPYRSPPDFKELAVKYPEFRKHAKQKLSGKIGIDFTDPAAVRSLTTVLLKKDFNLEVDLPPDRLIPTLPLRLNYLLWIEDLVNISHPVSNESAIHGIDIGAGACCIYSLLGAKKNNWHFTSTEADEVNFTSSTQTVQRNGLSENITIVKVGHESLLLDNISTDVDYDFTMCNPPFFDTDDFGPKSRSEKRPQPICPKSGGSSSMSEIAVKGGEVKFVQKLVEESITLKNNVRIFSTMVGHKASLTPIEELLRKVAVTSFTKSEFHQGRTMRWGIAWTFREDIPLASISCSQSKKQTSKPPVPLKFIVDSEPWAHEYSVICVMAKIIEQLKELKMQVKRKSEGTSRRVVEFTAKENTWSNLRRKRRAEKQRSNEKSGDVSSPTLLEESVPKKAKLDDEVVETSQNNDSFPLKGLVIVEKSPEDDEAIVIYLQWLEGGAGRESTNQILQYLKNRLFTKRE